MNTYPCNGCIVKGNCSEFCDKIINNRWWNYEYEVHKYMLDNSDCPDCGCKEGIKYDDGYIYIIKCSGCLSSFYPGGSGIIRHEKGSMPKDVKNKLSTTFKHFIDVLVQEYRGRIYEKLSM
jgi:hypothetical protein